MSIFNLIRLSLDFLTKNIKQLIMLTVILATGTILVCSAFLLVDNYQYTRKHTDEVLRYGNKGTGYMIFRNNDTKYEAYENIKDNNNISFGHLSVTHGSLVFLDYIKKEQRGLNWTDESCYNELNYISMSPEVFSLFNLEISEGSLEVGNCKDNELQIYIGANVGVEIDNDYNTYENHHIKDAFGDVIENEDDENEEVDKYLTDKINYKVCGKLNANTEIMLPEITQISEYIDETTINIDNYIIVVSNKPLNICNTFFYFSDNNNISLDIKDSYSSDISFGTIDSIFERMNDRNKEVLKYIKQLSFIIMLSVIIIQVCSQLANIIINANEYGIYYANGFDKKNIISIMMIEALLRFILASLLAVMAGLLIIKLFFDTADSYSYVMKLLKDGAAVKALAISFLVCIMAQIIPAVVVSRIEIIRLTKINE